MHEVYNVIISIRCCMGIKGCCSLGWCQWLATTSAQAVSHQLL